MMEWACVFSGERVVVKGNDGLCFEEFSSLLLSQCGKKSNPLPENFLFPEAVYVRKMHQESNSRGTFNSDVFFFFSFSFSKQEEPYISCRSYINTGQNEEGTPSKARNWISHIIARSLNLGLASHCLASAEGLGPRLWCGRWDPRQPRRPREAAGGTSATSPAALLRLPGFPLGHQGRRSLQLWNPPLWLRSDFTLRAHSLLFSDVCDMYSAGRNCVAWAMETHLMGLGFSFVFCLKLWNIHSFGEKKMQKVKRFKWIIWRAKNIQVYWYLSCFL